MVEGQRLGVALFLCPVTPFRLGTQIKLEKTSKQTRDFVLHFIVFACLRRARSASRLGTGSFKLEKTSKQFIGPSSFL